MTFRVVRTNQYNQDLGLIHSTNGNHLESPKDGSSTDHQVTIYLHAQNITMFPTNETWIVRRKWAEICVDIVQYSLFGHLQPVDHTIYIPQISLPAAVVPSTDYTEAFAQFRATVDKISLEKVQTRFHDRVVLVQNNVLRKEMQVQKTSLSEELDDIRKEIQDQKAVLAHDLLELRVESQEKFNTLSAHLYEIIAYINMGRDDKRGKIAAVEVHSLQKIKADQVVVVVGANLRGKEELDLTEEE
ncbi:hypothetical protein F511_15419 [Dorcoceras hygrometricum]|uniref:Uncharacterized protein n=1 Tax=Dorcoceras hygrometricum TaxID=472368 RepID=A0A2Z7A7J0_9LAMI|nr:hypothetical protein F511_15419 [Dorcoceras hygrometricum]